MKTCRTAPPHRNLSHIWLGLALLAALLHPSASQAGTVECAYDAAGRLVGVRYDAATNLTHHYDPSGSIQLISAFASTSADPALAYATSPAAPLAGLPVDLLIAAANLAPARASAVRLRGEIPAALQILSVLSSKGTCSITGSTLTCDFGPLASGEHALVRVSVLAEAAGRFPLSLSVTGENDSNPANNAVSDTLAVGEAFSLSLRLEDEGGLPELSWSALAEGLVVEEATSLQAPVRWVPAAAPSLVGDLFRVPVILGSENRFFRLRWRE